MFKIRREQIKVLSNVAREDFMRRLRSHLACYFPSECASLGAERLNDAIRRGVDLAESYEIRTERHVCKFLNLLFVFGLNFDADSWAKDILLSGANEEFLPKVDRLLDVASEHLASATGILRSYGIEQNDKG